jgi:predicted transglutaminase-like cysteine proteinase
MPKWQRVAAAEAKTPTFGQDLSEYMRPALFRQWQALVAGSKNATVLEKAKLVSAFFNRWPYRTDMDVWKVDDYWATPAEFLKRSGDCEDFAITKMYALMALGVDPAAMRIVALKDTIRNLAHAVLVVYTDNEAYILDNLTDMVLPHMRYRSYNPHYSVNGIYRWAHVVPKNK